MEVEHAVVSVKSDWERYQNNLLTLKGGVNLHYFTTMPGEVGKSGKDSNITPSEMSRKSLWDAALYAEANYKFLPRFLLNAGVRLSVLHAPALPIMQPKTFVMPEPVPNSLLFRMPRTGFSASYTQAAQSIHMLTTSSVGIPSDMWMPANALLKPSVMRNWHWDMNTIP